jgi:hypothetical protein
VPPIDRRAYAAATPFLARLKIYRRELTAQQWKTLRGQALSGDLEGAEKGLAVIVRRWKETGRSD